MNSRDFLLLCLICVVWALNVIVTRWVLAEFEAPPLWLAAIRFGLLGVVLIPFLRPIPEKLGLIFLISMGVGAAHFGCLFVGLSMAEAGAAGITSQLSAPFSTILSAIFLGEKVRWRRVLGIILSFLGVAFIAVDPSGFKISVGLFYIAMAAFIYSCANILMKQIPSMSPFRLQAWVGVMSVLPLVAFAAVFEPGEIAYFKSAPLEVWGSLVFAVLVVSIFGHGFFYQLLKSYDVALISPLTLMTPVWTLIMGVLLLNEELTFAMVAGSLIALAGVAVIAIRPNLKLPRAAIGRWRV